MTNPVIVRLPATVPPKEEPDAHGQAALMLVESLIHTLIDDATLTNARAIETVDIAAEVKLEKATLAGESELRITQSLELLEAMAVSLRSDA